MEFRSAYLNKKITWGSLSHQVFARRDRFSDDVYLCLLRKCGQKTFVKGLWDHCDIQLRVGCCACACATSPLSTTSGVLTQKRSTWQIYSPSFMQTKWAFKRLSWELTMNQHLKVFFFLYFSQEKVSLEMMDVVLVPLPLTLRPLFVSLSLFDRSWWMHR